MANFVSFELKDGTEVFIETDEPVPAPERLEEEDGLQDAGVWEGAKAAVSRVIGVTDVSFEDAVADGLAQAEVFLGQLRDRIRHADEIELTFGLKATGELGALAVASSSLEAAYSVKVVWKNSPSTSGAGGIEKDSPIGDTKDAVG